jgi:hypothetical protein|tara:strand:+ start:215 stop:418 length:204 start_codon:yes stop_codon:yes gene_type:complete
MITNPAASLYQKSINNYNKATPTEEVKGGFFNKPVKAEGPDINSPINRVNQYFNSIRKQREQFNGTK